MRVALAVAMGVLAGCASSKVQVSRTPWVKTTPQSPGATHAARADTTTSHAPATTPPPPPIDASAARVESLTDMSDREPPLLDSTVSSVATDAPAEGQTGDTFDKTFSGAGTVQEVGEDEILRTWPADADTTGPAASVPARAAPDTTPPAAAESTAGNTDAYGAISAPPARSGETTQTQTQTQTGTPTYVVQLYAFPTHTAADFAARQASRALGVDAWVEEVKTAAVPFKVFAGRFATRPPADDLRARAQKSGFPEAFVTTRSGGK